MGSLKQEKTDWVSDPLTAGRCDVVIPVKNFIDWLDRCLSCLIPAADPDLVGSIILVEDSCSEETKSFLSELAQRDSRIVVVSNDSSPGFAGSCNVGFRNSQAAHVLFLNSDCLLNEDTIEKMLKAFSARPTVGLACVVANNAANVSIPIMEGHSFVSMNNLLEDESSHYPDVCTTVGHCLMVSRECYQVVGGMDESWGLGYGEESDFHLRARAQGYLGVLVTDAYVYHFGGGTFRYEKTRSDLQQVNHARFMQMWGQAFASYHRWAELLNPLPQLEQHVQHKIRSQFNDRCDVLFVLPCLIRGIGGIHVILDLCNHLVMRGIDARVIVLGPMDRQALADYPEPLYVNPYHANNIEEFLSNIKVTPSVVVSPLYSTVPPCFEFAKRAGATLVNFIQGFETYFESGRPFDQVRDSYFLADVSIVTSEWLHQKVKAQALNCDIRLLPLGVNKFLFHPQKGVDLGGGKKLRVGIVLRASADKGQFVLRELLDMLSVREREFCLTVFKPDDYPLSLGGSYEADTRIIGLPAGRQVIADALRDVDIFVDASLHEGYGLFPLEAMACGACVVASDSGGVTQYLKDGLNGRIVVAVNKPEVYLEKIFELYADRALLRALRASGIEMASSYEEAECFDGYRSFFSGLIRDTTENVVEQRCAAEGV